MPPIVLALTGASGAPYGLRLLQVLLQAGQEVYLTISPSFGEVLRQELGIEIDLKRFTPQPLLADLQLWQTHLAQQGGWKSALPGTGAPRLGESLPPLPIDTSRLRYSHFQDLLSPIASGSALTAGMVVCPCSGSTLGAIAHSQGSNLIHRAAEVHLKERRKLILVPRETPLSLPQIENWRTATLAGAVVLPASPGFYHEPTGLLDLVDFVVARICDQLGVAHKLMRRWGSGQATE
ncbi:MAG: flavin prenyltransferase UbiX [Pirellulales bacterium]|nr:flavin prenyltransferase UbiX [Pirellulales bacterium]